MRFHPIRGLTSIQGVGDGGIGATCMVYSDDTPILIKGLAWASKAIYGERVQICDGVADEAEINAALTAIAAIGGTVLLSEGTFHMAVTASVPANCMLRGMGWGSILEYDAGGNCVTVTGDNAKVRDLKVDIVAGAGAGGTRPNCVYASGRANLELFGLWLVGDETVADDGSDVRQCGVVFDTVTYSSILSCVSEDHKRHGITLLDTSTDNALVENICNSNAGHGIYLVGAGDNKISSNTSMANSLSGITISGAGSQGNVVGGNICRGNTLQGIYLLEGADNNAIVGNDSSSNTTNGIYVSASDSVTLTGNRCNGNTQHGIAFANACANDTVTGNVCNGNSRNGIRLAGASTNNTITGNTCSGNTWHGISVETSTDNTLSGNSCNGNDSGDTGTYDGIFLTGSDGNLVSENACKDNDRWGIMVDADSDFNKISNNYTSGNTSGSIRVNNANCDKNQLEFNTVEEGAPGNVGTATRSYGNYDPSADAFVGDVGAAPF